MTPGIVGESDLSGNLTDEYVFFDGERVARKSTNGVFYYFSDHLKTASVITDSAGNIKSESDFYPWGGELQFVNNDSNHYKFTGKERDSETQLDYFGARYYSNGLGRWVSADWSPTAIPVPYADFHDPQSLNLYGFVGGNPASKADPDGHQEDQRSTWQKIKDAVVSALTSGPPLGAPQLPPPPSSCTCPEPQKQDNKNQNNNNSESTNQQESGGQKSTQHKPGSAKPEGAGKPFSKGTKDAARGESGNKCVFCKKDTTRQAGPDQSNIDHSIPKSRGGDNSLDNAQNTCRTCNLDKGTKTTEEYGPPAEQKPPL